jgi:hypothetical protein
MTSSLITFDASLVEGREVKFVSWASGYEGTIGSTSEGWDVAAVIVTDSSCTAMLTRKRGKKAPTEEQIHRRREALTKAFEAGWASRSAWDPKSPSAGPDREVRARAFAAYVQGLEDQKTKGAVKS